MRTPPPPPAHDARVSSIAAAVIVGIWVGAAAVAASLLFSSRP